MTFFSGTRVFTRLVTALTTAMSANAFLSIPSTDRISATRAGGTASVWPLGWLISTSPFSIFASIMPLRVARTTRFLVKRPRRCSSHTAPTVAWPHISIS
ncbi:MAG TPA: hypothetical protein VGI89_00285 [Rhizomicrobium sp.]